MRKLLAASLTLALMGCEARSQSDLQREALNLYFACLHKAASALDDHRSNASIIAEAAVEKCSGARRAAAAVLASQDISGATTIVLDERNQSPN